MIQDLWNRDFEMSVGGQTIAIQRANPLTGEITPALRVTFGIEKSDNRDPNRATVEIYNLSGTNRKTLQAGSDLAQTMRGAGQVYDWPLVVKAGYVGSKAQIFSGDIVYADSRLNGTEWVTTIEAEDGGNAFRSARLSKSYGKGTTVAQVLTDLAAALGVGLGNSAAKFAAGSERGYLSFVNGVAVNGKVSKLLDKYVTSAGYRWSIQDGQLQVLGPDETLLDSIAVISSLTGLVGSPERGEKGIVKLRSLLQPTIQPGRRCQVVSRMVSGQYKALAVKHFGDTFGQDWYTEFEGRPLT